MGHRRRSVLGLTWIDFAVFVAYVAVLCSATWIYLPWGDEGAAWIIARDFGLYDMLFKMLRYQGHPALWYLILWLPAHLHLSYTHINWISAAIAAAGIYVLLRYAPFPWYVRALLPFGFALQYQYAVVARSYVLFPLLGFVVAHLYRSKERHPIALALALALFANISIHATLVAIGLAVCFWRRWRKDTQGHEIAPSAMRNLRIAAAIFVSGVIFVAVCVWPPRELQGKILELLGTSQHLHQAAASGTQATRVVNIAYPALSNHTGTEARLPDSSYLSRTIAKLEFVLVYPVASFHALAYVFEALLFVYLYQRQRIELVLPIVLLVGFLTLGYGQFWHLEMLWVTFLIVLWIAWDGPGSATVSPLERSIEVILVLLCLLQLPWTAGAIRYELHDAMFPSSAAANYFKSIEAGRHIAGRGWAITLLPYFPGQIFSDFSKKNVIKLLPAQPDVIVGDSTMSQDEFAALSAADYREIESFCGSIYFPDVPAQPVCLIFFAKK
jgi:hypothetical protein